MSAQEKNTNKNLRMTHVSVLGRDEDGFLNDIINYQAFSDSDGKKSTKQVNAPFPLTAVVSPVSPEERDFLSSRVYSIYPGETLMTTAVPMSLMEKLKHQLIKGKIDRANVLASTHIHSQFPTISFESVVTPKSWQSKLLKGLAIGGAGAGLGYLGARWFSH